MAEGGRNPVEAPEVQQRQQSLTSQEQKQTNNSHVTGAENSTAGTVVSIGNNYGNLNFYPDGGETISETEDEDASGENVDSTSSLGTKTPPFFKGSSAVPNQKAMNTVAGQVGSKWRQLGRRLGLSDGDIETIKLEHVAEGQVEIVYQMLRMWTLTADPPASLSLLAQACVDIGRADIAKKLSLLPQAEEDQG